MGALIASLFAVGAGPATAAEIKTGDDNTASADVKPEFSACVGAATSDFMFSDVSEDNDHRDAINCLAHYGITVGKGDGTFAPSENVRASQMTAFMSRAATLVGADPEDVLGDVMLSNPVSRTQMALLLVNLVREGKPSLFNRDGSLKGVSGELDYFADARAQEPRAYDAAISTAYELGIAVGKTDATFGPSDNVTRAQMASFITRALAHTDARPAGVTIQLDSTGSVRVSVRTDMFEPVANARVDAFWREASRAGEVINEDGTCTRLAKHVQGGSTACVIDAADRRTDGAGNVSILGEVDASKGAVVWAWTGAVGDAFDADDTDFVRRDIPETASPIPATSATVTSDRSEGIMMAEFGDEVIFTVQLQGMSNGEAVDVAPPEGGASYRLLINNPDNTAVASVLKIDADGMATFALSWSDPDSTVDNPPRPVMYTLIPQSNARGTAAPDCDGGTTAEPAGCKPSDAINPYSDDDDEVADVPTTPNVDESLNSRPESFTGTINFDDNAPVATALSVDTGAGYALAPVMGNATNSVTVKVTDQYGNGLGNIPVRLARTNSSDTTAMFDPYAYTTNSEGETAIGYTYSGNAATQMFDAFVTDTEGEKPTVAPIVEADPDISFLWVAEPMPVDGVSTEGTPMSVVGGDLEANTIVVNETSPTVLVFDSNDQFTVVQSGNAEGAGMRFGMEAFVAALGLDADLSGKGAQNVQVEWTSYDATDSAWVARWELTLTVNAN